MTRVVVTLAAALLATVLSSCGGGSESGPFIRVVLEADVSVLPANTDVDEALESITDVLKRRLKDFGASGVKVTRENTNRLSVRLSGVSAQEARDLIGVTGLLEFRKPVLDEDTRNVVCETESGSIYALPFAAGPFSPDRENDAMTCPPNEEGTVGTVRWTPATATDTQGAERALTGSFLTPNTVVTGPPVQVAIQLDQEGGLIFETITDELVGLPLAIFLDEELIAAPTVTQPISGGKSLITGLDLEEARILAAQLNAGALPAPVRVIDVEEIP